jgi:putative heme-binding domain-containing protein
MLVAALGERSESTQLAALSAMDRSDEPAVADSILGSFPTLTPRAKTEAVNLMLKRSARALALLRTLKQSDLDASQVNQLLNSKDDEVRALARKMLSAPATRSTVVETFRPALSLKGDASKGKLIYEQRCISCHRAAGEGNAVGPDLITVKNAGAEKLLLNILDPSREVAANYINYLIETKDGQSVLGILASDTPSAIRVRQAYAKETVIPREQIKRMSSQGKSLMPDGLETGLNAEDVANLIAFIESGK